jgi:hypothetical protein
MLFWSEAKRRYFGVVKILFSLTVKPDGMLKLNFFETLI